MTSQEVLCCIRSLNLAERLVCQEIIEKIALSDGNSLVIGSDEISDYQIFIFLKDVLKFKVDDISPTYRKISLSKDSLLDSQCMLIIRELLTNNGWACYETDQASKANQVLFWYVYLYHDPEDCN